jgi:hypothetical protein
MNQNGTEAKLFNPPPEGKFMRQEHPELAEFKEFKELRDYQLRFVWYFANPTSPIIDLPEPDRAVKAVEYAFYEGISDPEKRKYTRCKFDESIRAAIKVMAGFNPTVRLKAKIDIEFIFKTIEKLIHVDDDDIRVMSLEDKKRYAELSMKVVRGMPEMISIMERGFGISDPVKKAQSEPGEEKISSMETKIKSLDQN